MNEEFRYDHIPYTANCDMLGWWKLSAVLDAMQTTADRHNEMLKCSRAEIGPHGLTWVLFKTMVQVNRYPRIGERISVRTYLKEPCMHFIPRYYELLDDQGACLGRGGSFWVLLDKETRKAAAPEKNGIRIPYHHSAPALVNLLERQAQIRGNAQSFEHRPECCDIDVNGHVNNIRYVDWLYNALGFETMRHCAISSASIEYYYETLPEDRLQNCLTREEDRFLFVGQGERHVHFQISGSLAERVSSSWI